MLPPLQLENYFFPQIEVVAQKDFKPDGNGEFPFELNVQKTIAGPSENGEYQVGIIIEVTNDGDKIAPYHIVLETVGSFHLAPKIPDDVKEKLLQITGCSMLYGMSREFLMSVTSRGPWEKFMLPTISFHPTPGEEE